MKKKNCLFTFAVILLSIALTCCSASKNLINTAKNISEELQVNLQVLQQRQVLQVL